MRHHGVAVFVDFTAIDIGGLNSNLISIVIIIAVLGSTIKQHLSDILMPLEVLIEDLL